MLRIDESELDTNCIDCRLCSIMQTPSKLRKEYDMILKETEKYEWIPGLGAFVEGYSLIVSKQHITNTGCLDDKSLIELEKFICEVKKILKLIYSVGILVFEHGSIGNRCRAGCCIEHHHLHLVPFNLGEIPSHMLNLMPNPKQIESLSALKEYQSQNKPYIYYETSDNKAFVFEAPIDLPSQYMRQILAVECGCPSNWEWYENQYIERIIAFLDKVKKFELAKNYI